METLLNISTGKSNIGGNVRSILIFVGIVTAIICSLVSMKDFHSAGRVETSASMSMESSKVLNAELVVRAAATMMELR